jgi:hypothetical protein
MRGLLRGHEARLQNVGFVPTDGFVILPRYKMSHPYARIYEPRSWVTGAQPVGTMKVL